MTYATSQMSRRIKYRMYEVLLERRSWCVETSLSVLETASSRLLPLVILLFTREACYFFQAVRNCACLVA